MCFIILIPGYLKDIQTREDSLQQYFEGFSAEDTHLPAGDRSFLVDDDDSWEFIYNFICNKNLFLYFAEYF